jgi:hypothetical protein
MTVPLDRLYHFIEHICEKIYGDRVIIYRFWPHGSKNIQDLNPLYLDHREHYSVTRAICPFVWCNDQEPLDYNYYQINTRRFDYPSGTEIIKKTQMVADPTNLNYRKNIFNKNLLLHSERRSVDLEKYKKDNELIPVYYWSHAVIARDWFRFAKYENFDKNTTKTFLIYNRAWSNTREYRLRFLDLLIDNNLETHCKTNCNPVDPESNQCYSEHDFKNPLWKPNNKLENFFEPTQASSASSADFETCDYDSTDIEVVLETLFDDDRLHLTEKTLRPIACGQPFLLAATSGSLKYLRDYGFKTFADIWNEDYDGIIDAEKRLQAITEVMKTIASWDEQTRLDKMRKAKAIANYNRDWFFSDDFWNLIVDELKKNLELAFKELKSSDNFQFYIDHWNKLLANPEVVEFLDSDQTFFMKRSSVEQILNTAKTKLEKSKGRI